MEPVTESNFDRVQWLVLENRLRRFGRGGIFFGPVFWTLILLILWGDTAIWRRWVLGGVATLSVFGTCAKVICPSLRKKTFPRLEWLAEKFIQRAFFTGTVLGVFILATGGFDGPLLPIAIPLVFFVGSVAPARALVATTVATTSIVALMAMVAQRSWVSDALPIVFGGGANVPQSPVLLYSKAGALVFLLVWAAGMSHQVRSAFLEIIKQAFNAKDEFLQGHEAHARELTALTGELAHELKNPLASVKGLAILIGRDVNEGRAAERLSVLKAEVDRMEQTLHEFLTFSRPLVPLSQSEVSLKHLCASVVTMHEGMAHLRQITFNTRNLRPIVAYCDPRKVKQLLTNLLQNALEVSPPGSEVELAVWMTTDGGARLEVLDRGPGVSKRIRQRLFEPGVTDKEHGSGLGLALARGLARQHGGELSLEPREGGGCIAVLTLPARKQGTEGPEE
ncbi:MAG: HAMP domain-containing sensor histidine kinase [Polyangiaceae bacterium]